MWTVVGVYGRRTNADQDARMHSTEEQGNVETERSFPETKLKKVTSLKTSTLRKIDVRAIQGILFINFQKKNRPEIPYLYINSRSLYVSA